MTISTVSERHLPNSANNQSYTYDNVGNRLTMTKNGTTLAYTYDAANRLNEIHQRSHGGPLQNSFLYDYDGNMTTKKNGSGTTIQTLTYDAKGRPSRPLQRHDTFHLRPSRLPDRQN